MILEREPGQLPKPRRIPPDLQLLKEIRDYHKAVADTVADDSEVEPSSNVAKVVPDADDTEARLHEVLWAEDFARQLRRAKVKVVFMNTCDSGKRDANGFTWTGVTPALLKAGIPVVIGMQFGIADETAISFAKHFYQALGAGKSVDQAVAVGRHALMKRTPGNRLQDFGVPVLYSRADSAELFPELKAIRDLPATRNLRPSPYDDSGSYGQHKDSVAIEFDREMYTDVGGFAR